MIYCIEGPDGVGKTTLWKQLRQKYSGLVKFVGAPGGCPSDPSDWERRELMIWEGIYDSKTLYVVDRGPWITGTVYAKAHKRTPPDVFGWKGVIRYIYLSAHKDHLIKTDMFTLDEMYRAEFNNWYGTHINALQPRTLEDACTYLSREAPVLLGRQ